MGAGEARLLEGGSGLGEFPLTLWDRVCGFVLGPGLHSFRLAGRLVLRVDECGRWGGHTEPFVSKFVFLGGPPAALW